MSNKATENAKKFNIALRLSDKDLYSRIVSLSEEQNISVNMAVNMLLGYAFNEADRQNKKFVSKIVFETEVS